MATVTVSTSSHTLVPPAGGGQTWCQGKLTQQPDGASRELQLSKEGTNREVVRPSDNRERTTRGKPEMAQLEAKTHTHTFPIHTVPNYQKLHTFWIAVVFRIFVDYSVQSSPNNQDTHRKCTGSRLRDPKNGTHHPSQA